jgi:hypothetical protein
MQMKMTSRLAVSIGSLVALILGGVGYWKVG